MHPGECVLCRPAKSVFQLRQPGELWQSPAKAAERRQVQPVEAQAQLKEPARTDSRETGWHSIRAEQRQQERQLQ